MASNINLNNIRVDQDTGRVSFSGIESGIDTEAAVNNIIKAKRIPIDFVERSITRNTKQIAGLKDYKSLLNNLRNTLEVLYGQPSLNGEGNIFESKQAFAGAARADGGAASNAASLIGVTVDNSAEIASQSFEVRARATNMEIATGRTFDTVAAAAAGLGFDGVFRLSTDAGPAFADPDIIDIVVEPTDNLQDIRDKINFANSGDAASGATAQIIGADTAASLVISADTAGETLNYQFVGGPDNIGEALDFVVAGATPAPGATATTLADFVNVASAPGLAEIALTDLPDAENGQFSTNLANETTVFAALGAADVVEVVVTDTELGATLQNAGTAIALTAGTAYDQDTFLNDILATAVAAGDAVPANLPAAGPAGGVVAYRELTGGAYVFFQLVESDDGGTEVQAFATETADYLDANRRNIDISFAPVGVTPAAVADNFTNALGFAYDPTVVTRNSNQINDLFKGVTLDLLQAEPGTTIELDIQNDLPAVKQAIVDFVDAYNEVIKFQNLQRQIDPLTGKPVEEAVLANTSALSQTEALFSLIAAEPANGFGLDFRALAQIGVSTTTLTNDNDDLLSGTLEIRDAGEIDSANPGLDNALLTNFKDVEALFVQQVSTNQSQLLVTSFTSNTKFTNENGIRLNFDPTTDIPAAGGTTAITYFLRDGAGAPIVATAYQAEVDSGGRITFTDGPADGLQLFYTGSGAAAFATDINITSTRGIGANFFYGLDRLIDDEFGIVNAEIDAREADNELKQTRVDDQLDRLERERVRLIDQFNRMEAALAQLESLKQQVAAAFGEKSDGN